MYTSAEIIFQLQVRRYKKIAKLGYNSVADNPYIDEKAPEVILESCRVFQYKDEHVP